MALHNRSDDKSWKIMSSLWQILYKERYYEPSCKEDSQVIHNTAFLFFRMLRYSVTCCCPYLIYIYDRPIYGCFTMIIICADPWYPLSWSIQYKLRIYTEILCHECFNVLRQIIYIHNSLVSNECLFPGCFYISSLRPT